MTIEVKNSFSDYLNLSLFLLCRKTGAKILLVIFILFFSNLTLRAFGVTAIDEESNDQNLLLSWIICVAVPALLFLSIYLKTKSNYFSDRRISENIIYKIERNKLIIVGESFESKRDLDKSFKIEETKKWFIIYETFNIMNIIPKKCLTMTEISEIRYAFETFTTVELKLLNPVK